eukprot:1558888-Pyramimonas_sp.AAC.1
MWFDADSALVISARDDALRSAMPLFSQVPGVVWHGLASLFSNELLETRSLAREALAGGPRRSKERRSGGTGLAEGAKKTIKRK